MADLFENRAADWDASDRRTRLDAAIGAANIDITATAAVAISVCSLRLPATRYLTRASAGVDCLRAG